MNLTDRNIATWIVYCAIYVCGFVALLLLAAVSLEEWDWKNIIPMLSNVTNAAIGIGLLAALTWEVIRCAMVIFYPILKKSLMEQGRQEGLNEGLKEGREEGREEVQEAWEAWNKRREEALANNQPFDESPPSRRGQDTTL